MLVFWMWGTLLICGIYGRGFGDEIQGITTYKIQNKKPQINKTAAVAARNINANIAQ
jgi:hypothetical protein